LTGVLIPVFVKPLMLGGNIAQTGRARFGPERFCFSVFILSGSGNLTLCSIESFAQSRHVFRRPE
jgi:hypothetical protein